MSAPGLAELAANGRIDPGWAAALLPVEADLIRMEGFLDDEEAAGHALLPGRGDVLRAFRTPFDRVRVVILGQDPYPTPGHPIGLAFAVDRHVRPLPRSLTNIYLERQSDLGLAPAAHGDLSAWTDRGVLLLNRCLTVRAGQAGSHAKRGWESVTAAALGALADRRGPLVAVLWGKQAQTAAPVLADVPKIHSAHPSPLSARNGFFGSRPFSRVDALLAQQGAQPIDWSLPRVNYSVVLEEEYVERRVKPFHLRRFDPPEAPFSFEIRVVEPRDLPDVREIYNHYVTNSVVTFDEDRMTLREWKSKYAYLTRLKLPFLVAVSPSGQVLGYALCAPWNQKRAYRFTAENSIYLRAASTGKGLGHALLAALLDASKQAGLKEVLAIIADSGAEASLALHRSFGFKETGRMGHVGFKFDHWIGTVLLQKSLK